MNHLLLRQVNLVFDGTNFCASVLSRGNSCYTITLDGVEYEAGLYKVPWGGGGVDYKVTGKKKRGKNTQ